ncbi:ImmA/IrrE family metallo-endopeptidase [Cupriavidus campinensis]
MKLVQLWRHIHGSTYPIRAGDLAVEWSRQVSPDRPIGEVLAQDLPGFEGGLFWLPTKKEWVILHAVHEDAPGRANFTIGHEFGHYVLHRSLEDAFRCSQSATLGLEAKKIEREADLFASYLLMPNDDFREQVKDKHITLDVLAHCASRYGVSLTAAILKWIDFTERSAIVVFAREGILHWWRASSSAKRYGFDQLREGMELPARSLAVQPRTSSYHSDSRDGTEHPAGVWFRDAHAREMVIISDRYDMSISLLMIDDVVRESEVAAPLDLLNGLPAFK